MTLVPNALLRYLPDSELSVLSWDGTSETLLLRVEKEIGPEIGTLILRGVSFVSLPASLTLAGLDLQSPESVPPELLSRSRPGDTSLDADEQLLAIHEVGGGEFFVIAKEIDYEIENSGK